MFPFRYAIFGSLIILDAQPLVSSHFIVWVVGIAALMIILIAFEEYIEHAYKRRLLPHSYHCLPCHNRGDHCEFLSTDEEALRCMIADHNRTVHLWEK